MTLKEKFNVMVFNHTVEDWSKECEQIADDYAIEFVEWKDNYCFEVMGSNSSLFYIRNNEEFDDPYTNKQLLEIFKKEKGL